MECHHRRGRIDNETTRFHYDVVLHAAPTLRDVSWMRCDAGVSLEQLRGQLRDPSAPPAFGLTNIPNARIASDVAVVQALGAAEGGDTTALRLSAHQASGFHPEDVWALQEESAYDVQLRWSASARHGCFDALFVRRDSGITHVPGPDPRASTSGARAHVNNPSAKRAPARNTTALRDYLRQRLPDYMVPASIVFLQALPLTGNGKLDMAALPQPVTEPGTTRPDAAPETALERTVAEVWREVLRLDDIGRRDDFFERGGHSLLAVQVIVKLRDLLRVDISLGSLFEAPTVEQLARRIEALQYIRAASPGRNGTGTREELEEIEL